MFELEARPPTFDRALDIVYGQGIEERGWFRRIFKALAPNSNLRKDAELMKVLREYLYEPNFDPVKFPAQVKELVRSTIFWMGANGKLHPTTPLVDRLLFLCTMPGSRAHPTYSVTAEGIDQLIIDVVSTMSGTEMPTDEEHEYSWAVKFYHRLVELLPAPHIVNVEARAISEGKSKCRLDMYLPTLKTSLEYVANGNGPKVNEHHARFYPPLPEHSDQQLQRICALLERLVSYLQKRPAPADQNLNPCPSRQTLLTSIEQQSQSLQMLFLHYTSAMHAQVSMHPTLKMQFESILGQVYTCNQGSLQAQVQQLLEQFSSTQPTQSPQWNVLQSQLQQSVQKFLLDLQGGKKRKRGEYVDPAKTRQYRVINFLGPEADGEKLHEVLESDTYRRANITVLPVPGMRAWKIFYGDQMIVTEETTVEKIIKKQVVKGGPKH